MARDIWHVEEGGGESSTGEHQWRDRKSFTAMGIMEGTGVDAVR